MVGKRQYLPPPPPLHLLQLFIQFFNMYPGLRVHSPLLAQEGQLKWRSLQFTVKTKHLGLYLSLKDVLQLGIVMPTRSKAKNIERTDETALTHNAPLWVFN